MSSIPQINGHDVEEDLGGQQIAAPKKMILNAFDMTGTLGHLSPGQWKVITQKHNS